MGASTLKRGKVSAHLASLREACLSHYLALKDLEIPFDMAKFNQPDPRNEGTWCWVNGLVRREDAKVSVLDSVVQEEMPV